MTPEERIDRYLLGQATAEDIAILNELLDKDEDLRRVYRFRVALEGGYRECALREHADSSRPPRRFAARWAWGIGVSALAALLMVALLRFQQAAPKPVAMLIGSEDAAWESELPTRVGSPLGTGQLTLRSGLATIRFESGAVLTLEAPADVILHSAMSCELRFGAAILDVPESAQGFKVKTPRGFAIDHGTRFLVSVDRDLDQTDFTVLDGEISVHQNESDSTGKRLGVSSAASINATGIRVYDPSLADVASRKVEQVPVVTVGSGGKSASVVRSNRADLLRPDLLLVKSAHDNRSDRLAFFSIDLASVDLQRMESVALILNQVPSGMGIAALLPEQNSFSVYGLITDFEAIKTWENAPPLSKDDRLGSFHRRRSQQRGQVEFQSEQLQRFIRKNAGREVTFCIRRDTTSTAPYCLVHAFAADPHAAAAGPVLRFTPSKEIEERGGD